MRRGQRTFLHDNKPGLTYLFYIKLFAITLYANNLVPLSQFSIVVYTYFISGNFY